MDFFNTTVVKPLANRILEVPEKRKKILVVDDEPNICHTIRRSLKLSGYVVNLAYDGDSGLRIARSHKPNLIILDILMPQMDGLEMARSLKKSDDTSYIPILFLSGLVDLSEEYVQPVKVTSDESSPFLLGDCYYMSKPCNHKKLLKKIREIL